MRKHAFHSFPSVTPHRYLPLHKKKIIPSILIWCQHERQGERKEESTKGVIQVYLWIWVEEGIKDFFKVKQEEKSFIF